MATRRPPATTPEERENELIEAAVDLAEKQLRDGSASAQVVTFYLKLGSSREKLEQERLRHENDFLVAKREALEAQQAIGSLIEDALDAMRRYQGVDTTERLDANDVY
jgi:hypothetical protein